MATYAIGDIQGCYRTFQRLLERIEFDSKNDRLLLAGDLVNRGPRSLEVLDWVYDHQGSIRMVLGNHDLYLLARGAGSFGPKGKDSLGGVLKSRRRDAMLEWLRQQPLLLREGNILMIHAGLLPNWTAEIAEERARRIENALRSDNFATLLGDVRRPSGELSPARRALQVDIAVFTRLRMLRTNGTPEYMFNGTPEEAPDGLTPWFELSDRRKDVRVMFGHWAALGLRILPHMVALDSGCVWGHVLSAYRLDDGAVFQYPFAD